MKIKVNDIKWQPSSSELTAPKDLPSSYEFEASRSTMTGYLSDDGEPNEFFDDFIVNKLQLEFNWAASNFNYELS